MSSPANWAARLLTLLLVLQPTISPAQAPPYDVFPEANPPYYRVRYESSSRPGELAFSVNYTIWIPSHVKTLRGVVVHQHGCGEGSCKSGLSGAYDLHWQSLARNHDCALLSPVYEQTKDGNCQLWCDPRNGSAGTFQRALVELGQQSGHPELAKVPWALWGHSGGGHWAGGMVLMHPQRVAAAWLRSGVPLLKSNPNRPEIKVHDVPDRSLGVPVMCNLGTKEGVTVKDGRFSGVWPATQVFFNELRKRGGLVGVAIDPLTSHECGNQRYLAIPWLDTCLENRLPRAHEEGLRAMPTEKAWLAAPTGGPPVPMAKFAGNPTAAAWLPNEKFAKHWMEYVKDTGVTDHTPPPQPTNLVVKGNELSWKAEADLESGLARFVIERDGRFLANVPADGTNRFGRPVFQNLLYSDTPTLPLIRMGFTDETADANEQHRYRVFSVNTVGLTSDKVSSQISSKNVWSSGAHKIVVDGIEREFLLDVPSQLQPNSALVFVFHGYTDSARSIRRYSGFSKLVDTHGFVAVYPQGTRDSRGKTFFQVGYSFHEKNSIDDVKLTRTLTDRLVKDLQLDPKLVFATGMSNGGDMSYFLASQDEPFVRAIAPVAGTMMKKWGGSFIPRARIPVLHVHGTADRITKWQGDLENRDGWGAYLSLDQVLAKWVDGMELEKVDVAETSSGNGSDQPRILRRRWSTDVDDTVVQLYRIEDGGHVWPKHLDEPETTTAAVIWEFFSSYR